MANHLALTDDVNQITRKFQDLEASSSTSLHRNSSPHQQNFQSLPPNVDIEPENMTYEESRSEMSAKDCRRQESVKYQLISTGRPHGLKRKTMLPKILSVRYVFSNSSREIRYRLCHVLISIIRNAFHYGWNKTRFAAFATQRLNDSVVPRFFGG
ncbi:unnamed protein product [Arabis nemorensis]|uniref:Uncharacterized protein n=1 Tax=Arabis nemorensis TaxID=586526 RepID=A0A565CPP8_9BRAS|nr:unnamed protein product [Arabis nemorensis]